MRVAIISDIHDNAHNLVQVLELIEKSNVEKIVGLQWTSEPKAVFLWSVSIGIEIFFIALLVIGSVAV